VPGDGEQVLGADPRRQQRLVRVAEGGVGDRQCGLLPQRGGERLGSCGEQLLA
jgi:hypothetical protein